MFDPGSVHQGITHGREGIAAARDGMAALQGALAMGRRRVARWRRAADGLERALDEIEAGCSASMREHGARAGWAATAEPDEFSPDGTLPS